MSIAILDPAAGLSGDMLLGALLDVGAAPAWLEALPRRLGYDGVAVTVTKVQRASVAATKVDFAIPGDTGSDRHDPHPSHGHHVGDLMERIRRAPLSGAVKAGALRTFELLAEAEGRVHGMPPERVHLHEVGATDAVLDIVGTIEGLEHLGVSEVYHLPVAVGTGWVDAAHGALPVPAPATAVLLEGQELVTGGPVRGEATTPTGAALLRALSRGRPPARWRLTGSGWGAGSRDPEGYPNALRLMLAEPAVEAGVLEVVTTDVDDLRPEYLEPVRTAVLAAGAVECFAWAVQGKKGRVALRIEALAPADRTDAVEDAMLRHAGSAGVRRVGTTRITLPRHEVVVTLAPGMDVRVKVWQGPEGPRWKAEYDDVVAAAARQGLPAWRVAQEVERRAAGMLYEANNSRNEEQA